MIDTSPVHWLTPVTLSSQEGLLMKGPYTQHCDGLTHLLLFIPAAGRQVVRVTPLDTLFVMVIVIDIVLHEPLVPIIPFSPCCFLLLVQLVTPCFSEALFPDQCSASSFSSSLQTLWRSLTMLRHAA